MGGGNERQKRAADAYGKAAKASPGESDPPQLPADTPAFEKVSGPLAAPATDDGEPLRGPARVARLLIAMGPDRASDILSRLSPEEVEQVTAAIMQTPSVRRADAERLVDSIGESVRAGRLAGGPEMARDILVKAFGEDRAERFFRDSVPDSAPRHFQFLDELETHQLRLLFRDESPGAIAVVITHLERQRARDVLAHLPAEKQTEVVRRVAGMGRLNREVIVRIEEAVREKIRQQGRQVTQELDGQDTLAAILRHMAPGAEGSILRDLELEDPEVARSVKERLYTVDLLLVLSDRDLADILREFTDTEIALFLKGKSEELRARALRAVSERRRIAIAEEYAHLGPQLRKDVDEVTHALLEHMRRLEEDGSILVPREGDRYI